VTVPPPPCEENADARREGEQQSEPRANQRSLHWQNVIASQPSFSTATVEQDLSSLVTALESAYTPMRSSHWFFSQRTKNYLYSVRDPSGRFLYRSELNNGLFRGWPWSWTQNIPDNLGGGSNQSEVYLVDMDEFVIADVPELAIDAGPAATYSPDGANYFLAFDRDETVIRIIAYHDCNIKHDTSAAVLTGVLWQ
jgi:HK97 family phage major capsid protein